MKRIATVGALALTLTTCAVPANSSIIEKPQISSHTPISTIHRVQSISILPAQEATLMESIYQENRARIAAELAHKQAVLKNQQIIKSNINKLKKHIGKTRYVFSGSTPRGWDCSGLVKWFYGEIGIELPHSATKQGFLKPKVKQPVPGDIVVTKYKNSKNFIHSGIYIGDNKMIHSGFKPGQKTEIIDLSDPSFANQKHFFVRIIQTTDE